MLRTVLASSLICGLIILLVSGFAMAADKPVIEILEEVEVTAKAVTLGDIALLSGFGELEDTLKNVHIGPTALPGSSVRYSVGQIQVRLRQAGFDPLAFELVGAPQVVVITPKPLPSATDNSSNLFSTVKDNQAKTDPGTTGSSIYSTPSYQVVVPVIDISRHEIITEEMLRVETRVGNVNPRDLATVDDLVGKRATRLLVAGTVLYLNAAEIPPLIERNDRVTIIAEGNGILISTLGVAQQGGGLGDIIPVRNSSSGEIIYAEIVSSTVVKVNLGGVTK